MIKDKAKTAGRGVLTAARWITPWGLFSSIYKREVSSKRITEDEAIEDIKLVRRLNIAGLLASLLGLFGLGWGIYWTINANSDTPGYSWLGILLFVLLLVTVRKAVLHTQNLQELNRRKHSGDYTEEKPQDIGLNYEARAVFLFRASVYRNIYALFAGFSIIMALTPSNARTLSKLFQAGDIKMTASLVIVGILLMITLMLGLRALIAQRDIRLLRSAGAEPSLEGYVTVNNSAQLLIQISILMLGVAYIGELLLELAKSSPLPIWAAGVLRPALIIVLLLYSYKAFRSVVSISGLQTASSYRETGLLPIMLFRSIKLEPPKPDQIPKPLPPVTWISAVIFGATIFTVSKVGWAAAVPAVTALLPVAVLLATEHFHPELAKYGNG